MTWAPRVLPPPLQPTAEVLGAVQRAAAMSRTPFGTLLSITAAAEGRRPEGVGPTPPAAGVFRISEATWLQLVRRHGAAAGRPDLAALVKESATGFTVDAKNRQAVLDARQDPAFAARLAARYCDECRDRLTSRLGRPAAEEEVRLAYLLGARGAAVLIAAAAADPQAGVHELLPGAFARNRVVLSQHGRPLTAQQALAGLKARFAMEIAQTEALRKYADSAALTQPGASGSAMARIL